MFGAIYAEVTFGSVHAGGVRGRNVQGSLLGRGVIYAIYLVSEMYIIYIYMCVNMTWVETMTSSEGATWDEARGMNTHNIRKRDRSHGWRQCELCQECWRQT